MTPSTRTGPGDVAAGSDSSDSFWTFPAIRRGRPGRLADPIVGLLITVAILGVLRSALRQVGIRLMDAVDPQPVEQATAAAATVDGVRSVDELRIRWLGHTLRAEAAITVDPHLSLVAAHDIAHHAEERLLADVRRLTAATVHTSPAGAHP